MPILAFKGSLSRRKRDTKRFAIPREEFIGGLVDIEPGQPRRLMRGCFDPANHATEINTRRMRTKTPADPIANVLDGFDVEPGLLSNLANDGLHGRLPRLERPPRQLPAE